MFYLHQVAAGAAAGARWAPRRQWTDWCLGWGLGAGGNNHGDQGWPGGAQDRQWRRADVQIWLSLWCEKWCRQLQVTQPQWSALWPLLGQKHWGTG